eukprot:PRCOL_00001627-RA
MEAVMAKRVKAYKEEVEAMWDDGKGSLHPDFDPSIDDGVKAPRETEELAMAIVKNDLNKVYTYIEEGADVNFVFGDQYSAPEGYTPLMIAAHRGRLEAAKALLRAGADPNYMNNAGDTVLFWGIDGGIEIIKLLVEYGPEDVLLYYGATEYGTGPTSHGTKSPRNSYDPEADDFMRERNSYQEPPIGP